MKRRKVDHPPISNLYDPEEYFSRMSGQDAFEKFLSHPSVLLIDPQFPHNVGNVLRCCAAYGIRSLWFTGTKALSRIGKRLPREERMKGYGKVTMFHTEEPFKWLRSSPGLGIAPVCVEILPSSVPMASFTMPRVPIFIFGPENGEVPGWVRAKSHQFVRLETEHCLNLAVAVGTTLYMYRYKALLDRAMPMPVLQEQRG